ncbi:MAG: hypothetical protein C4339_02850 [Nitrososphaerota archaeon]
MKFRAQEIGSLKKPSWRLKAYRGDQLEEKDIEEARYWGRRLGVEGYEQLIGLLRAPDSEQKRRGVLEWSVRYALRFFEVAGLDVAYTGEQLRVEMYEHVVRRLGGFRFLGSVNSFDYAYYRRAAAVNAPSYYGGIYLEELSLAKRFARLPLKVPITGPYTLMDWSYLGYYEARQRQRLGIPISTPQVKRAAREEFLFDLIDKVYRPEVQTMVRMGVDWIQIDEPAATTHPWEMETFVEAMNRLTAGVRCRFSLHVCYSDYPLLAQYAPRLKDIDMLVIALANVDGLQLGVDREARRGYLLLKEFSEYGYRGQIGLGVLDVHKSEARGTWKGFVIESPELVRDRILFALRYFDAERLWVNPDCGGRRMPWEVYMAKLTNMVRGAELAAREA